jgi:hypothetical protein
MNVTQEVMTDLLPVYFSGEASEDTKRLMEDYFRENPDFERIARSAARPLETLRASAPVAPEAGREKRDLQWVRDELFRRRLMFGVALLFTFVPFVSVFSHGGLDWTPIRDNPWLAVMYWSIAVLAWFLYFLHRRRRTWVLVVATFWTVIPLVWTFHLFLPGWETGLASRLWQVIVLWISAVIAWMLYFRVRSGKSLRGERDAPGVRKK